MTQTANRRDSGIPPWAVVLVFMLCIGAGGLLIWWFLGDKEAIVTQPVPDKPRQLMEDHHRFIGLVNDGLLDTARELLNERADLIHSRDPDAGGATLLHSMAWAGHVDGARLLIDAGADLEAVDDRFNATPLGWAVVAGQADVAELLLKHKSSVTPQMGEMVVDGINGEFASFAPGTPADYQRIAEMLRGRGIESERVAEVGFIAAVRADGETSPAQAPGVREIAGERLDDAAVPAGLLAFAPATWTEQGLEIHVEFHNSGVVTESVFGVPIRIAVEARTDRHNIRLYFADAAVILGWEQEPAQLRVHHPITGEREGIDGAGTITPDAWQTIVWTIEPDHLELTVDGQRRLYRKGDYSTLQGRVGIGTALGSTMTVRRLQITPEQSPTTEPAQPNE